VSYPLPGLLSGQVFHFPAPVQGKATAIFCGSSVEIDENSCTGVVSLSFFRPGFFVGRDIILLIFSCWNPFMQHPETIYYSRLETPAGKLLLAAGKNGLRCVQFGGELPQHKKNQVWIESAEALRPYEEQLNAYFHGDLREFNCKLDLEGTEFQKKCWQALLRIPYGKTCSYADIARQVGSPRSFRAVGQANHHNPIAIIVPCHRVITSSGALGGYGGGLALKQMLLDLETRQSPQKLEAQLHLLE
jgi:methylated-DNA-[protein]-cysteine S-methyltransferase